MDKNLSKSSTRTEKPFKAYYSVIGKACGCSGKYAKLVLTGRLGKYSDRDTDLVKNIRQKAAEIRKVIGSECDFPC